MKLNKTTELIKTIFRTLEIPPETPFRCKGVEDAWYKLTEDCVPLWDAGTDQIDWFEDWVVLNHLLKGILEPDWGREEIDNLNKAIDLIEKAKEGIHIRTKSRLDCAVNALKTEIEMIEYERGRQ